MISRWHGVKAVAALFAVLFLTAADNSAHRNGYEIGLGVVVLATDDFIPYVDTREIPLKQGQALAWVIWTKKNDGEKIHLREELTFAKPQEWGTKIPADQISADRRSWMIEEDVKSQGDIYLDAIVLDEPFPVGEASLNFIIDGAAVGPVNFKIVPPPGAP